jgi:ribonuclease P/MRP protein subunit RPP1
LQLTRLTVSTSEALQPQAAWSQVAATYDLVAVQPKSERAMQQACTSLDCDLICLNLSARLPFKLRPNLIKAAVQRGLHFVVGLCVGGCVIEGGGLGR